MSAIGDIGTAKLHEREESEAFSRLLLAEYLYHGKSYLAMARRYGCSESLIARRIRWAKKDAQREEYDLGRHCINMLQSLHRGAQYRQADRTTEVAAQMLYSYGQGNTYEKVGEQFGVSTTQAWKMIKSARETQTRGEE